MFVDEELTLTDFLCPVLFPPFLRSIDFVLQRVFSLLMLLTDLTTDSLSRVELYFIFWRFYI